MPEKQRRAWGASAASAIVILVTLCVLVISGCGVTTTSSGAASGNGPATATTASGYTTVPTPTGTIVPPTKKPPPTPTTAALNYPSPIQAWGANAIAATVSLDGVTAQTITPDGLHIMSYRLSSDKKHYDVGWLAIATKQ